MQQRKSHTKSRHGCHACKARHIKCDEQGPTCANCLARDTPCIYPPKPKAAGKKRSPPTAPKPKAAQRAYGEIVWALNSTEKSSSPEKEDSPEKAGPPPPPPVHTAAALSPPRLTHASSSGSGSSLSSSSNAAATAAFNNMTLSPLAFSSTPCSNKALELELMHRWSTSSWKMLYAIPDCVVNIQTHLTRAALKYSFMTKAVLAAAALETYMYGGGADHNAQTYLHASLQYMTEASADHRRQLTDITQDNLWLLSDFSAMMGMYHFALPSSFGGRPDEAQTALARTTTFFELIIASFKLSSINWTWSLEAPTSAPAILSNYPTDFSLMNALPPETNAATKHMSHLSRLVRLPPTGDPELDEGGQGPYAAALFSYRTAIGHTRYSFAEHRIRGYCVSVASAAHAAGPEFFRGLRAHEPVALFVVMYWGVLMHAQTYDGMMWWIAGTGRELVREVSEMLATTMLMDFEDARGGIVWCRAQVGLDPLPGLGGSMATEFDVDPSEVVMVDDALLAASGEGPMGNNKAFVGQWQVALDGGLGSQQLSVGELVSEV